MNIADILEQHAQERPKHGAIEHGDQRINYEQLWRLVLSAERHLSKAGVNQGDVVGVMLPSSAAYVVTLFALAKLGAVILGVDERLPEIERKKAIDGFDIKAVVAHPAAPIIDGAKVIGVGGISAVAKERFGNGTPTFDERKPLMVVQSSGTTGKPKSVVLSHDSVRTRILRHEKAVGVDESDRLYLMLDMSYSGSRRRSMAMIYLGGTVILNNSQTLEECVREIIDRRTTWLERFQFTRVHILQRRNNFGIGWG